jgi:hypothetical protein
MGSSYTSRYAETSVVGPSNNLLKNYYFSINAIYFLTELEASLGNWLIHVTTSRVAEEEIRETISFGFAKIKVGSERTSQ